LLEELEEANEIPQACGMLGFPASLRSGKRADVYPAYSGMLGFLVSLCSKKTGMGIRLAYILRSALL
jgi:hypothetical protein